MTEIKRHCFIYTEEAHLQEKQPTGIHYRYFVKIGDKYYQVIGDPDLPRPFQMREENRFLRGWRFYALDVNDDNVLSLLNERKIPYLELDPDCVERCEHSEHSLYSAKTKGD